MRPPGVKPYYTGEEFTAACCALAGISGGMLAALAHAIECGQRGEVPRPDALALMRANFEKAKATMAALMPDKANEIKSTFVIGEQP